MAKRHKKSRKSAKRSRKSTRRAGGKKCTVKVTKKSVNIRCKR